MTFDIVQTVTFLLYSAADIVRDYPWKNFGGLTQRRVSLALFGLSLVGFLSMLSILVTGDMGPKSFVVQYIALGSIIVFLAVATLSLLVWGPRKERGAVKGKNGV